MAETSQNWNIEIIPGSRRVRRAADRIRTLLSFPSSEGYPSDYPKHPERRNAPAELPFPGQIGGVAVRARLLEEANDIIN